MRSDWLGMRIWRLGWRKQALLAEALMAVAVASAAIRFAPFERAVRLGSRELGAGPTAATEQVCDMVRWAVEAVAARVPWRAVCFQQGLALQWMLRRRGIDARLHYGVGKGDDHELRAHVWISAEDRIVIGGEQAPHFRALAVYP